MRQKIHNNINLNTSEAQEPIDYPLTLNLGCYSNDHHVSINEILVGTFYDHELKEHFVPFLEIINYTMSVKENDNIYALHYHDSFSDRMKAYINYESTPLFDWQNFSFTSKKNFTKQIKDIFLFK